VPVVLKLLMPALGERQGPDVGADEHEGRIGPSGPTTALHEPQMIRRRPLRLRAYPPPPEAIGGTPRALATTTSLTSGNNASSSATSSNSSSAWGAAAGNASSNASATVAAGNAAHTNGTHNNNTYINGTATLAPAADLSYQDRVRVALLSLYVTVLVLCFALPVLYYTSARFGFHSRRGGGRGRRNGNNNNNDDNDDDPEDDRRLRRALERSQLETSSSALALESRAVRRKYVEERRARVVQLLAPVQLVRYHNTCFFVGSVDGSRFCVADGLFLTFCTLFCSCWQVLSLDNFASPADLPEPSFKEVGLGGDGPEDADAAAAADDDDDEWDDSRRVRIPVPGLLFGSRRRLMMDGEGGGSMGGSSRNSSTRSLRGLEQGSGVAAGDSGGGGDVAAAPAAMTSMSMLSPRPPLAANLGQQSSGSLHSQAQWGESRWAPGTCSICLCPYQVGETICWSSNRQCDHCFHSSCIETWLLRQRDGPLCPICRRDFLIDPYDVDFPGGGGATATTDEGVGASAPVPESRDGGGGAPSNATSDDPGPTSDDGSGTRTASSLNDAATAPSADRRELPRPFALLWLRSGGSSRRRGGPE
jgi:Ring finger domain